MRSATVAVAAFALAVAGCRSGSASTSTDASTVASAVAPQDAAIPDAPMRALPAPERLLAPFRGTKAHGFVAVTNTDGSIAREARRTIVSLVTGEALDLTKPVLIASFTKLWTAVATLRMVERVELSLDLTVKEALPELASRPWASSTIRELRTHTSLLPELDEKGGYYRRSDVDVSSPVSSLVSALVSALAKHVPRDWTEKRGIYKYRNSELAMVGAILAQRSTLSAERVLAREVFEPDGMKHAGLLLTTASPPGLDLAPMGPIRPQNFFTAGAGYASAGDLLAFFEALAGEVLLTAASKALLFDGATERNGGALGWGCSRLFSRGQARHHRVDRRRHRGGAPSRRQGHRLLARPRRARVITVAARACGAGLRYLFSFGRGGAGGAHARSRAGASATASRSGGARGRTRMGRPARRSRLIARVLAEVVRARGQSMPDGFGIEHAPYVAGWMA